MLPEGQREGLAARNALGEERAPRAVGMLNDGSEAKITPSDEQAATAGRDVAVWPNPAKGGAHVAFTLDAFSEVRLTLYDVLGRSVFEQATARLGPGEHRLALDLSALPAGVYVWRVRAGERLETGRITVAR